MKLVFWAVKADKDERVGEVTLANGKLSGPKNLVDVCQEYLGDRKPDLKWLSRNVGGTYLYVRLEDDATEATRRLVDVLMHKGSA